LLIWHSKYSTVLSKIDSYTDCFFGDIGKGKIFLKVKRTNTISGEI